MADLELVKGATEDIYMVLADRDGPITSGSFSTFTYELFQNGVVIQTTSGTALPAGRVKFSFDATDTGTPGHYQGHVRATRANSTEAFFPSGRAHAVVIREAPTPS